MAWILLWYASHIGMLSPLYVRHFLDILGKPSQGYLFVVAMVPQEQLNHTALKTFNLGKTLIGLITKSQL